jgi:hypothetical protein
MYRRRPSVLMLATIMTLQSAIGLSQPIAAGPISDIHLDRFVSDPNQTGGTAVVNVGRGTYRLIAGAQDPTNYEINTPYATIVARGAVLEMAMEGVDCERIRLVSGSFRATTLLGQSVSVTEPNTVVTACAQLPIEVLAALAGAVGVAIVASQPHKKPAPPVSPLVSPN